MTKSEVWILAHRAYLEALSRGPHGFDMEGALSWADRTAQAWADRFEDSNEDERP